MYTLYADDVLLYNESVAEAREALRQAGVPRPEWPAEVAGSDKSGKGNEPSQASDSRLSAEKVTEQRMQEVMQDVDPSLKAFLE